MSRLKAPQTPVAPRENPLVPFALMKRLYAGMVETRLLEMFLAKRPGKGKETSLEGDEACRTAVLLNLEAGDLAADYAGAAGSAWLRGTSLTEIVSGRFPSLLPLSIDASHHFAMALGAAAAVKQVGLPNVVPVFLEAGMKRSALRLGLSLAAREELPMLFIMLPAATELAAKSVAAEATRLGVPGIPVEAHDAVALCRVAQESLLRARAGGGPALIECIRLESGKRALDPIDAMAKTLLRVGAADQAWLDEVGPAFKARLKSVKHERSAMPDSTKV